MHTTPEIDALLSELLTEIRGILDRRLMGFYLYGSLVWGDFDDATSDIDLLAALTDDLTAQEAERLAALHAAFAVRHPRWDDRIEVQYMSQRGLKHFRTETHKMGNISPGEPFHIIDADRAWLMNWYFVRVYGVTLYGVPSETLIDPISKAEFLDAIREHVDEWGDYVHHTREHAPGRAYAVLTLCRALCSLETGEQVSKPVALAWAQTHLPDEWQSLLNRAAVARRNNTHHELSYEETVRFVEYARQRILNPKL